MENIKEAVGSAQTELNRIVYEVEKVIIGKESLIKTTLAALLANGHVLFEDTPGIGKTMLIKALARSIDLKFSRIQFTPDLLPSDILGVSIYNMESHQFEFRKGPIFAQIILADEINRTTPKTQAALLEAMSEHQVTMDGTSYPLSDLFFVLATQNPIEYEGTFPLPEAQLDRFLVKLTIGYPTFDEELALMTGEDTALKLTHIQPVMSWERLSALKALVDQIFVDTAVVKYALRLVEATRNHPKIALGISPRGSLAFLKMARAMALLDGRSYCTPDDFINLVTPVFSHRILLKTKYSQDQHSTQAILNEIISSVSVPVRA